MLEQGWAGDQLAARQQKMGHMAGRVARIVNQRRRHRSGAQRRPYLMSLRQRVAGAVGGLCFLGLAATSMGSARVVALLGAACLTVGLTFAPRR